MTPEPRSSRLKGHSFTCLVPVKCVLTRPSTVHSLVRLGGAVVLSRECLALCLGAHGCSSSCLLSHVGWEVLHGGSTPGRGSFLSHPSGHAWPAPWRLGAQSLPHQRVLADEIALFSLRSNRQLDSGPAFHGVKAITLAGHRSPSLLRSIRRFESLCRSPDPTAIVTVVRSLGHSEELLAQVRAAFPPLPAQTQKKEQRLLQLRGHV